MINTFMLLLDWLSDFVITLLQSTAIGYLVMVTLILCVLEFIINLFINLRR